MKLEKERGVVVGIVLIALLFGGLIQAFGLVGLGFFLLLVVCVGLIALGGSQIVSELFGTSSESKRRTNKRVCGSTV